MSLFTTSEQTSIFEHGQTKRRERKAFDIVNELTGDEPPEKESEKKKDPAAVKRSKARTAAMTAEEGREIAKKAAAKRWKKKSVK